MDLDFITLNANHAKRVDTFEEALRRRKRVDLCDNNEKMVLESKTIDLLVQESSQCNSSSQIIMSVRSVANLIG
jgi:hypothetical protein